MDIFLKELRQKHKASVLRLYLRHKAGVGYVILAAGLVLALFFSLHGAENARTHADQQAAKAVKIAQQRINERVEKQAAVICENSTRNDRTTLENFVTKSGNELIADFHLTLNQAAVLTHKQLEQSAQERMSLQPSKPASACSSKITTLDISKLHPPATHAQKVALKIATKQPPAASTQTPVGPTKAAPVHRPPLGQGERLPAGPLRELSLK